MFRRTLTAAALLALLSVPAHADTPPEVPPVEEHTAPVPSLLPVHEEAAERHMAETIAEMEALEAEVAALYPTSSIREDRPVPSLPSTGVAS